MRSDAAAPRAEAQARQATITVARAESQARRDEVARLEGLPPRPPSRPSGLEAATEPGAAGKDRRRSQRRRGATRDRDAITAEVVVKAAAPPGSRLKGCKDIGVARAVPPRGGGPPPGERWLAPSGETMAAPSPLGVVGGFGPERRRFVLAVHAQGQVTTKRLKPPLEGTGGGDLRAPGRAPALSPSGRPCGRGSGCTAGGPGHGRLDHGGRRRRPARPRGRRDHPARR